MATTSMHAKNNEAMQRSSHILLRGPRSFLLPLALKASMRNASSRSGAWWASFHRPGLEQRESQQTYSG